MPVTEYNQNNFKAKIVLVGECTVGKTSILNAMSGKPFNSGVLPTYGTDIATKDFEVEGIHVELSIWDTAGQERFCTLGPTYYRDSLGIIVVYDVTDKESFKKLSFWLADAEKKYSGEVVKMIVGNKIDLENHLVSSGEGQEYAEKNGALYVETSAKTGQGIDQVCEELVKKILQNHKPQPEKTENIVINRVFDNIVKPERQGYCQSYC